MEENKVSETKEEKKKNFNFKKSTNKEFKALFGGNLIWNSRNQGTRVLGRNQYKREQRQLGK